LDELNKDPEKWKKYSDLVLDALDSLTHKKQKNAYRMVPFYHVRIESYQPGATVEWPHCFFKTHSEPPTSVKTLAFKVHLKRGYSLKNYDCFDSDERIFVKKGNFKVIRKHTQSRENKDVFVMDMEQLVE